MNKAKFKSFISSGRAGRLTSGLYHLVNKESRTVGYNMNNVQRMIFNKKMEIKAAGLPLRLLALKARQGGFTTGECMYNLDDALWHRNRRIWMMAHKRETVASIFGKIRYAFDRLPEALRLKPRFRSRNELYWPATNSSIRVTADPTGETIDGLHVCEVALINNAHEIMPQYLQGVPKYTGSVVLESTAYGAGGWFYDQWKRAWEMRRNPIAGSFIPLFIPWTVSEEYRSPVPGGVLDPSMDAEERDLVRVHGCDDEQIQFRREKIAEFGGNVDLFRQFYPITPEEAFIASGLPVFDQVTLHGMLNRCVEPTKVVNWFGGELREYRKRDPRLNYLISVDTSEGDGSDSSAAIIMEAASMNVAAVLHGKMEPNNLGRYLNRLGIHFNGALVAVERNNHGHSVLNTLVNHEGYENVYKHVDYEGTSRERKKPGFPTTVKTRPLIIDDLIEAIASGDLEIPDAAAVAEHISFQWINGKPQAPPGSHDDLVMAMAIGVHVRKGTKLHRDYPHELKSKPEGC